MTTTEPTELKLHCANHSAYSQDCYWCNLRNATRASTPPAAPVAEDAVSAMAKAITAANDAVLSAEDCQDYNFAAMIAKSLADQGFTIAPIAQPVADETAARCGEAQPGSKPDNSIPGAAVLDEKLREAVAYVFESASYDPHLTGQGRERLARHTATIEAALAELAELRAKVAEMIKCDGHMGNDWHMMRFHDARDAVIKLLPTPPATGGI